MNTRVLVASAFAAAIAAPSLLSAQKPAEMPGFKAEKCYGIARAGKNDCASAGANSCGGTSKKDGDKKAYSEPHELMPDSSKAASKLDQEFTPFSSGVANGQSQ